MFLNQNTRCSVVLFFVVVALPWGVLLRVQATPLSPGYHEIAYGLGKHACAMQGCGPERTGRSGAFVPARLPSLAWQQVLAGTQPSAAVVASDGALLISHGDGVTALDRKGDLIWRRGQGPSFGSPAWLTNGDAVWLSRLGTLHCVSHLGEFRWTIELPQPAVTGPLVLDDSLIVFALRGGTVVGYDANGAPRFTAPLPNPIETELIWNKRWGIIATTQERLYALSPEGQVSLLRLHAGSAQHPPLWVGEAIWTSSVPGYRRNARQLAAWIHVHKKTRSLRIALGASRHVSPLSAGRDGIVHVGTGDGYILGLDAHGSEVGRTDLRSPVRVQAAVDDAGTVLAVAGSNLYAIEPGGAIRWQTALAIRDLRSPVLDSRGRIVLTAADGTIQVWR